MLDKDGLMLEWAMLVTVKAGKPFLRIREKEDPVLNLDAGRQSASLIVEAEALRPFLKNSSSRKGKRRC